MTPTHSLLLLVLICGSSLGLDSLLRGVVNDEQRHLEAEEKPGEASFNYEVYVEEETEIEIDEEDTEEELEFEEPDDDMVVCMERAVASRMEELAERYMQEEKSYDASSKWGRVTKVIYRNDQGEITLTMNGSSDQATVRIRKHGKVLFKKLLSPFKAWGGKRQLPEIVFAGVHKDTFEDDAGRSLQTLQPKRKKRRRLKRWNALLKVKATCTFCNPDSSDMFRRVMIWFRSFDRMMNQVDFESWMNQRLKEEILRDCLNEAQTITETTFHYVSNGEAGSANDEIPDETPKEASKVAQSTTEKMSDKTPPDEANNKGENKAKEANSDVKEADKVKMCCSEDRVSCTKSDYCNEFKWRCESKCKDSWINPSPDQRPQEESKAVTLTADSTTHDENKPVATKSSVKVEPEKVKMCCSNDRITCKDSSYCNASKWNCESKCKDSWINAGPDKRLRADKEALTSTDDSTAQGENKPEKAKSSVKEEPEKGEMCCSKDRVTCMESDYCNESRWKCELKCNDSWIDLRGHSTCIPLDGDCTEDRNGCCEGGSCQDDAGDDKCKPTEAKSLKSKDSERYSKPASKVQSTPSPPVTDERVQTGKMCCSKESNMCTGSRYCNADESNCRRCGGKWIDFHN